MSDNPYDESVYPYDLKKIINQYSFQIFEYIQTKNISIIKEFMIELQKIGDIRGNKFIYTHKHEYSSHSYIEIIKTSLGNEIIMQKSKIGLYNNSIYILIK